MLGPELTNWPCHPLPQQFKAVCIILRIIKCDIGVERARVIRGGESFRPLALTSL